MAAHGITGPAGNHGGTSAGTAGRGATGLVFGLADREVEAVEVGQSDGKGENDDEHDRHDEQGAQEAADACDRARRAGRG